MTEAEVDEFIKKDEYGLYVNSPNYPTSRANIVLHIALNQ